MGAKVSRTRPQPPAYRELKDDEYCVIEKLQYHFETKVLGSLSSDVAEHEMFKLYVLAKMYGINIPVSLKTLQEFQKMSNLEKDTHNRLNMGLVSLFLGSKWIDT